uniref:NADH-ubiquinone oxidoreductase chain 2 n=1 Tax=Polyrhachis dives TaxID=84555 RepID=A0A1B0UTU8_9HYME|nr:NADH dehydrogenase subunit 2 [Polyrhachis dives]AMJ17065.1 NADH dehydrogenase subunit 2 [Polyrhachis dives]
MFFNIFIKYIIITNLFLFSISSIFLNDLLIIWFFMEINNFMFICLLSYELFNKKIIFMYFIIQSISSLVLLLSLILNIFLPMFNYITFLLILTLNFKLGVPPFHLWMHLISMFMNWKTLFFLLSVQKFIPLYILSLIELKPFIIYFMVLSSSFISIFKMINLMNLKLILTYSSINQLSWMLLLTLFKNILWLMYFFMYLIILLLINLMFTFLKFSSNFFINIYNKHLQFIILFMFFNLASMPPLSFFFMKWLSIYILLFNSDFFFIFIILLFNSFILIYIYINMINLIMFFYSLKLKLFFMPQTSMNFFLLYLSFFLSLFLMLI